MGVPERKEREKEQRRMQIISSGETLFAKQGFMSTTMEQIAEHCEISRGTIYLYFKNKEELLEAIVVKGLRLLYDNMKNSFSDSDSFDKKLSFIGEAYLEFYKNYRNCFVLLNYLGSTENEIKKFEEMHSSINSTSLIDNTRKLWGLIVRIIDEGIDAGFVRENVNSYETAIMLWAASNGIIQIFDHILTAHHGEMPDEFIPDNFDEDISHVQKFNLEKLLPTLWGYIINSIRKK